MSEGKSMFRRYLAWFGGQAIGIQILVTVIAMLILGATFSVIASLFGVDLSPLHTR